MHISNELKYQNEMKKMNNFFDSFSFDKWAMQIELFLSSSTNLIERCLLKSFDCC